MIFGSTQIQGLTLNLRFLCWLAAIDSGILGRDESIERVICERLVPSCISIVNNSPNVLASTMTFTLRTGITVCYTTNLTFNVSEAPIPAGASSGTRQNRLLILVAAKEAPEPSNTRLSVGNYIADILIDARPDPTLYHWIVQRVGSAAIIQWGQEYSFEDVYSIVTVYLENLNRTDKKKA